MDTTVEHIHIFKTNITSDADHEAIAVILNKHTSIEEWNIDREDVDRVLRIASHKLNEGEIIKLITQFGFMCRELV